MKSDFKTILQKWPPCWDDMSHATYGLLPLRSRRCVAHKICVATLKVKVTIWPFSKIVSGPQLCDLKSNFTTISHKSSPYWDNLSRATYWLLPWRPRSQHDLATKSCLAQNFVIWSWILQLLLTNYFSVSNTYLGSITRFWLALVTELVGMKNVKFYKLTWFIAFIT